MKMTVFRKVLLFQVIPPSLLILVTASFLTPGLLEGAVKVKKGLTSTGTPCSSSPMLTLYTTQRPRARALAQGSQQVNLKMLFIFSGGLGQAHDRLAIYKAKYLSDP